jgi:hypothetical protein
MLAPRRDGIIIIVIFIAWRNRVGCFSGSEPQELVFIAFTLVRRRRPLGSCQRHREAEE